MTKTRLIGAANLNPASFRRYLAICLERDLIRAVDGGYVATGRAGPLLEVIDTMVLRAAELERSLQALERPAALPRGPDAGSGTALLGFYREAWKEIVLHRGPPLGAARSGAVLFASGRATGPLPGIGAEPSTRSVATPLLRVDTARRDIAEVPSARERARRQARAWRSRRD